MISDDRRGKKIRWLIEAGSAPGITIQNECIELNAKFTAYVSQQVKTFFKLLHVELEGLCEKSRS